MHRSRLRVAGGRGPAGAPLVLRVLVALLVAGCWLTATPAPARADGGPWTWPLAGPHEVSRPFAPPADPYGSGHRGVDLAATPGAPVRAAGTGRVSYAGMLAGRGVVVVVHGSLRTTYEPVTATVGVGAVVAVGEQVGLLEAAHAGCAHAACLHWGLRRGEDYLDPVRLVERGPVRLLPVGAPRGGHEVAPPAPVGAGAASSGDGTGAGAAGAGAGGVAGGPPGSGSGRDRPDPGPEPARAAAWSLRAADAPLGATALAALVAGIGLLARPRPSPDDPPVTAGGALPPSPEDDDAPLAPVLELSPERERRRTG